MKTKLFLLAVFAAVSLFSAGCQTVQADVAKVIPPGNYKNITATVTGKFSATQFTAEDVNLSEKGVMTGGHVHIRHSNIWVPLIEVDVQSAAAIPASAK